LIGERGGVEWIGFCKDFGAVGYAVAVRVGVLRIGAEECLGSPAQAVAIFVGRGAERFQERGVGGTWLGGEGEGLLVRTPTIGGAENAACFSYSHSLRAVLAEVRLADETISSRRIEWGNDGLGG